MCETVVCVDVYFECVNWPGRDTGYSFNDGFENEVWFSLKWSEHFLVERAIYFIYFFPSIFFPFTSNPHQYYTPVLPKVLRTITSSNERIFRRCVENNSRVPRLCPHVFLFLYILSQRQKEERKLSMSWKVNESHVIVEYPVKHIYIYTLYITINYRA